MNITTFQQTRHPKEGVLVTEVSQSVFIPFDKWLLECEKVAEELKFKSCKSANIQRTLKTYYQRGWTPTQAVKKYFI